MKNIEEKANRSNSKERSNKRNYSAKSNSKSTNISNPEIKKPTKFGKIDKNDSLIAKYDARSKHKKETQIKEKTNKLIEEALNKSPNASKSPNKIIPFPSNYFFHSVKNFNLTNIKKEHPKEKQNNINKLKRQNHGQEIPGKNISNN